MDRRRWFTRIGWAALGLGSFTVLAGFGFRHGMCGAHGDPARMEQMISEHLDEVLDDIQATPDQRQKIAAVKDRLVEKGRALHSARREGMQELLAQWESPSPDTAAVHARIDARAKEMQAFAHDVADGIAEVHAVLTPEQRAKIAERWKKRMDRFQR